VAWDKFSPGEARSGWLLLYPQCKPAPKRWSLGRRPSGAHEVPRAADQAGRRLVVRREGRADVPEPVRSRSDRAGDAL
jgi:hypothetical protein